MSISKLILFNDHQIVVCAKPAGLPTQDDKTGDKSLHALAESYCKRKLHILHRLDRPVSGLVVFAKTKETAAELSRQFAEGMVGKTYLALVKPGIDPQEGELEHVLFRDRTGVTRVANEGGDGKLSKLEYKLLRSLDNYDLLEVKPITGRTHQIRAQLSAVGHPVKGDVKYGARRGNRDRSIHLHCSSLEFFHPTKNEVVTYECPVPARAIVELRLLLS